MINLKNSLKLFLLFIFSVSPVLVHAIDDDNPYREVLTPNTDEYEYDDSGDVPWKEDELDKLTVPSNENFKELDIDEPPIGFKVLIDPTSINVSETDSIVRYWLVLKAGKSRNVMYEGIRCNASEYKTYAFVNKWKKNKVNVHKSAQWIPIAKSGQNQFRHELKKYYFCSDVLPRPVSDIRDIIAGYKSTTSDIDPTYQYAQ